MGNSKTREAAVVLMLVVLGMCLRYAQTARNFVIARDSTEYLRTAVAFEKEGGAALKVSLRQPLYPLVLWAGGRAADMADPDFRWQNHQMAEVGRLVGVALYLPFLLAAWFFFRRFAGIGPAVFCLSLLIVHPAFAGRFANVLSETLYLTFLAAGLAFLTKALDVRRKDPQRVWKWALLTGFCAVLAFLTRAEGQLLLVSGLVCLLFLGAGGGVALERVPVARRVRAALWCVGGFVLPAAPVALYLGATSRRYSWEWLWRNLAGQGADGLELTAAGLGLVATPAESAWMLLVTLLTAAPVITVGACALALGRTGRDFRARLTGKWSSSHAAVLLTLAICGATIIAGASLRLGTVSTRYVQPIVLMALPLLVVLADAASGKRIKAALSRRGALAMFIAVAGIAYAMAFLETTRRWERSKAGYRDAGVAIWRASETSSLITSSPRLSYYAGSSRLPVGTERLKAAIISGDVRNFDFVGFETKAFDAGELVLMRDALAENGFGREPWLDLGERPSASRDGRRILIFRKGPANG